MNDQAAIDGAEALAMTAIDFFTDANLRAEVVAATAGSRSNSCTSGKSTMLLDPLGR